MSENFFDVSFFAEIWKAGDSLVITIPAPQIRGLNLREKEKVYINLKKIGSD